MKGRLTRDLTCAKVREPRTRPSPSPARGPPRPPRTRVLGLAPVAATWAAARPAARPPTVALLFALSEPLSAFLRRFFASATNRSNCALSGGAPLTRRAGRTFDSACPPTRSRRARPRGTTGPPAARSRRRRPRTKRAAPARISRVGQWVLARSTIGQSTPGTAAAAHHHRPPTRTHFRPCRRLRNCRQQGCRRRPTGGWGWSAAPRPVTGVHARSSADLPVLRAAVSSGRLLPRDRPTSDRPPERRETPRGGTSASCPGRVLLMVDVCRARVARSQDVDNQTGTSSGRPRPR